MSTPFREFVYGPAGTLARLGIDHVCLAKMANISKSSMSEYMRGLHSPSPDTAAKIAAVLGTTSAELSELIEVKKAPKFAHGSPTVKPLPEGETVAEKRIVQGHKVPVCTTCQHRCAACAAALTERAKRVQRAA